MPRQPELERILEAWFALETCDPSEKQDRLSELHALMDAAVEGSNVSRQDLVSALSERYHQFRTSKEKEIKAKLSRLR